MNSRRTVVERGATARLSDGEVIARSVAAPELFGVVFERRQGAVAGFVGRRVAGRDVDDVVGVVFEEAFRCRERYVPSQPTAEPWLVGIAANQVRRCWRDAGRLAKATERHDLRLGGGWHRG